MFLLKFYYQHKHKLKKKYFRNYHMSESFSIWQHNKNTCCSETESFHNSFVKLVSKQEKQETKTHFMFSPALTGFI